MANRTLVFEEGYKTYDINGDPDRVIKVNVGDYAIFDRWEEVKKKLEDKEEFYAELNLNPDGTSLDETEEAMRMARELDKFVRSQINYVFNADVADVIFGKQSCLSIRNGEPLWMHFMNIILAEVEKDMTKEAKSFSNKMSKYTNPAANKYKKKGKKK